MFRLLELCAGYGSQALALKNLGLDVYSEIAEIDEYASRAYMQLHGETKNYGDIYAIDETKLPYFDMITYSTPCQDFSVAGKGKGGDKGSGTRSSLLWECERIIRAVKPKYLLMENVKNLLSEKHRHNFNEWFKLLEGMGYTNYYKVLNSKDYGIPQNRERVFCVSILGGGQYLFPNPIPLEKRLKDMLEPTVSEKFYLTLKQIAKFVNSCFNQERDRLQEKDYCDTILSRDYKNPKLVKEPLCAASRGRGDVKTEQHLEINHTGCTNTLTSVQKDNYIIENNRIRKLTPRECWRLMGVKDEQFDRLHDISNSQLYKLAGNSIVVDVLEAIFRNLLMPETADIKGQLSLF